MTESGNSPKKERSLFVQMLPGIFVSLLTVVILVSQIDLTETAAALKNIRASRLLLAAFFLVLAFSARGLAWRTLLREQAGYPVVISSEVIGYFLNTVLPFRLGEVGRALALGMRSSLTFWEIFPTLVVERIFDLAILAGLLLTTLPFVVGAQWATTAALVAVGLVVVGFAVLYTVVLKPEWAHTLFQKLTRPWPKLQTFGEEKLDLILRGLAPLRNPGRFLLVLFWMLVTWGLSILWNYMLLEPFYPDASLLVVAVIVGFASLGVAAPSTQGNLGVYEAAVVSAFLALNANTANGLAYALATHALYLLLIILMGVVALSVQRISLKEISAMARSRRLDEESSDQGEH
ncbi:MAG TPA: lysylphosphatidylglycerol synthase transmembrane domain-containing protein [Anaerolineales bacterium]|nr:lysylphosphatidylglycerol synthase transmembrane domain-containing protein [Anaerolineales bacterium]